MWYDVVIGNGERYCTAIHVFEIEGEHSISKNVNSFRIRNL